MFDAVGCHLQKKGAGKITRDGMLRCWLRWSLVTLCYFGEEAQKK